MVPPQSRFNAALTLVEILVLLGLVILAAIFVLPAFTTSMHGPNHQMLPILSNQRQLTLATQLMALEGATAGNPELGWPAESGGTFSNWAIQLIANGYLRTNDFCKLLSAPGKIVPLGTIPRMEESGVLVYAVSSNSPANTVFLSSANFTNTPAGGTKLDKKAVPYGDSAFVIFRKDGAGMIGRSKQVGNPRLIGEFAPLCR